MTDQNIESLENPETFKTEMENAGFRDVVIKPIVHQFPVSTIEDF